jgi:hypothetical protein
MQLAPAVIVHGLAMARLALGAGRPATLLSAPGAGAYAGVGWWRALVAQACPDGFTADILDCGEAPGRALEALRAGQRLLVLRCDPVIWADLSERAHGLGATLLDHPPPALDMAAAGSARRLAAWLESGRNPAG